MTADTIIELLRKLLDILLVWGVLYFILKSLRKNIKMVLLFKLILIIIVIKLLSVMFNLVTIGYLIDYIIEWAPLALIVIFHPEIREALDNLGHAKMVGRHKTLTTTEKEKIVSEVITSIEDLRRQRRGALIVFERDNSLADYINGAQRIYADITNQLLSTVFFVNNPLNDGGVIIQGDQIACANAIFPTSDKLSISRQLGTRHRAALGISEQTDCVAVVLSEETSRISLAVGGELLYNVSIDQLKAYLLEALSSKKLLVNKKGVK